MYKQIIPADGWHFVAKDTNSGRPIVHPVAAWALIEKENEGGVTSAVIGLIGEIPGGGSKRESSSYKSMARLVTVPPIEGEYKHVSCMTEAELSSLKPKQPL